MTKGYPALSGLGCKLHQGILPTVRPQSMTPGGTGGDFFAIADPQGCAFAFGIRSKGLRDGAKASKSHAPVMAILRPLESFRARAPPTGEVIP
jgi:hypothetical protein